MRWLTTAIAAATGTVIAPVSSAELLQSSTGVEAYGATAMRSWGIALPWRFFCVGRRCFTCHGNRSGGDDKRPGGCRAETGFDAAFVWPSLQAMDRLRSVHSLRDKPESAKADRFR